MNSIFNLFNKKHKIPIISVQELTLKTINMRVAYLYQIGFEDAKLKLELYREFYFNGKPHLELEKKAFCTDSELIDLMNRCNIIKWDGFHGKHPKNVSDGTMFVFSAIINNGQVIRADGSENFPKGYREFVCAINEMLAD